LEAKLDSTVKNLNKKKLATEWSKNKGAVNKKAGTNKGKSKKKDGKSGEHPKTWAAPKAGDKKEAKYKDHMWLWCGKDTGGKCEKWHAHQPKECNKGGGAAENKISIEIDGKKTKKVSFSKKLKILAKPYVAKIKKQAAEKDLDDKSE
jgi:hypothetical protein